MSAQQQHVSNMVCTAIARDALARLSVLQACRHYVCHLHYMCEAEQSLVSSSTCADSANSADQAVLTQQEQLLHKGSVWWSHMHQAQDRGQQR